MTPNINPETRKAIAVGDTVTVYDKLWTVDRILTAEEVAKTYPDPQIGRILKEREMRSVILAPRSSTMNLDLVILKIHLPPQPSAVLIDKQNQFHDPKDIIK